MNLTNLEEPKWIQVLSNLFQNLDDLQLQQVLQAGVISKYNSGEKIFNQGDIEDTFSIVLSGRFRAIQKSNEKNKILGDITEGETVGEFAFFSNDVRSATVYALRPSVTLKIDRQQYLNLVSLQPKFAQKLSSLIVNRFKSNSLKDKIKEAPKNIAIINLDENTNISAWTQSIENELLVTNVKFQLYEQNNSEFFFDELESNEGINFLVCSPQYPSWSKQCYLYADLIIIATKFDNDSSLRKIESDLELYSDNILSKKVYLLLLHPENTKQPKNTKRWLDNRKVNLHIHFRENYKPDAARFCRIITNKAIGVVLGGGGAKGFAHLGALKALTSEGVNVDFIGGTSAGALYGLALASFDFDFTKMDIHTEEAVNKKLTSKDFTYPIISLMSGKKMKKYLYEFYNETCLEDFWVTSYCITSNLSKASLSMHKRGLAAKKVLASIAIPGIFPPVIIDHELHVDGGVMDNLPIDSMYQFPVGEIIALSLVVIQQRKSKLSETPSSRELILNKFLRRKKYKLPGITSILMNSLTLNSVQKQEENKSKASLYIELSLKGLGFIDDAKWKIITQRGFVQTKLFLSDLDQSKKFWQ